MKSEKTKLDIALGEYENSNPITNETDLIRAIETIKRRELSRSGEKGDVELIEEATAELNILRGKDPVKIRKAADEFSEKHLKEIERRIMDHRSAKKKAAVKWIIPIAAVIAVMATILAVSMGINKPWKRNSGDMTSATDTLETGMDEDELYFPERGKATRIGMAELNDVSFISNVGSLFEVSDVVILGQVIAEHDKTDSIENQIGQEEVMVRVDSSWKGEFLAGDSLTVIEMGERKNDGFDLSVAGEPLLRKGMKVILFLSKKSADQYEVFDNIYGKFFLDDKGMVYSCGFFLNGFDRIICPVNEQTMSFDDFKRKLDFLK